MLCKLPTKSYIHHHYIITDHPKNQDSTISPVHPIVEPRRAWKTHVVWVHPAVSSIMDFRGTRTEMGSLYFDRHHLPVVVLRFYQLHMWLVELDVLYVSLLQLHSIERNKDRGEEVDVPRETCLFNAWSSSLYLCSLWFNLCS